MIKRKIYENIVFLFFIIIVFNKSYSEYSTENIDKCNLDYITAVIENIPIGIPVSGIRTLQFKWYIKGGFDYDKKREIFTKYFHPGVDIANYKGIPIKATASGVVIYSGYESVYGNSIKIKHKYGFETFYAHCSILYVYVGNKINKGDIIGLVGATGNATGNLLHYEILLDRNQINPANYLIDIKELNNRINNCSPLHNAVISRNHKSIIKILKEGVDKNIINSFSLTPLKIAELLGDEESIRLLK